MRLKADLLVTFVLVFILGGITHNASATHISEPILLKTETEYFIGDKVVLEGWVNYNNQSTPDVLLDFKVLAPDGSIAKQRSFSSNSQGQFKFEFDTIKIKPGIYKVTVTSQCLEIHRPICTYKSQTVPINVREKSRRE